MLPDCHGWHRATWFTDHGTATRCWFQHTWTVTTTTWVMALASAENRLKNEEF
jgi:hypothetical protein